MLEMNVTEMMYEFYNSFYIEYGTKEETFWKFRGQLDFVDKWFLMDSPLPLFIITMSYLLFVVKLGPNLMKNRKAYSLTNVLLVYNVAQVIFSMYICYLCLKLLLRVGLIHKTCNMETAESRYLVTSANYVYFTSKLTELLDTVFFVFRKKQNQISFLHIYHHFFMAWCAWVLLKYEPGYSLVFAGAINSFVHIIMYTYYGLSAFPRISKYLWWKRYITKLQLFQFVSVATHYITNLALSECKPSKIMTACTLINISLFIYLFTKFYIEAYLKKCNVNTKDELQIDNGEKDSKEKTEITNDRTQVKNNYNIRSEEITHKKRYRPIGDKVTR